AVCSGTDVETDDAVEIVHLRACQCVLRMGRETRVENPCDLLVVGKELRYLHRVGGLLAIAQKIRLETAQDEEGRMRIEKRAEGDEVFAHHLDQLGPRYHRATHDVTVSRCVLRQAVNEEIDLVLAMTMK